MSFFNLEDTFEEASLEASLFNSFEDILSNNINVNISRNTISTLETSLIRVQGLSFTGDPAEYDELRDMLNFIINEESERRNYDRDTGILRVQIRIFQLNITRHYVLNTQETTMTTPEIAIRRIMNIVEYLSGEYHLIGHEFNVHSLTVGFNYIRDEDIIFSGGIGFSQALKKYFIIGNTSISNCVFKSVYIGKEIIKGKYDKVLELLKNGYKKLNRNTSKLKKTIEKKFDKTFTNGISMSDICYICEYLQMNINVYNNVFDLIETIKPISKKSIHKANSKSTLLLQAIEKRHFQLIVDRVKYEKYFPKELVEIFNRPIDNVLGYVGEDVVKVNSKNEITFKKKKYTLNEFEKTEHYDKMNLISNVKSKSIPIDNDKFIKRKEKKNVKDVSIDFVTFDIEATPSDINDRNSCHKAYCIGISWKENNDIEYKEFFGLECIKDFFEFIQENRDIFNDKHFYAHNNGKYDILILFKEYILESSECIIDRKSILMISGSIVSCDLYFPKVDLVIKFRDSLPLLPASLDSLTKDFNVEHKKLTGEIDHNKINIINYIGFKDKILKYLKNDVIGLLEVLIAFHYVTLELYGFRFTKCLTLASLSKADFFTNYYNKFKYPIYTLSDKVDTFIREAYFGGRNECFKIGQDLKGDNIVYVDINSLYPSVGRRNLPYGKPINVNTKELNDLYVENGKLINGFFGFVKVRVKTLRRDILPLIGYKYDKKLTFPIFEDYTTLIVFSEEIKASQKDEIYDFVFIEAIQFKESKILKNFFEETYELRLKYKSEGEFAKSYIQKIKANSGYGYLGLKSNKKCLNIYNKDDNTYIRDWYNGSLINYCQQGNYGISYTNKTIQTKEVNVGIAAAITSYARLYLYKALTHFNEFGEIYYCDTDSIIGNINVRTSKQMKAYQSFMNIYHIDDDKYGCLGGMKDEIYEKYFKIDKDLAISLKENSRYGLIPFQKLSIGGCKQYYGECNYSNVNVTITAFKGFKSGFSYEEDKEGDKLIVIDKECPETLRVKDVNIEINEKMFKQLFDKDGLSVIQLNFKSGVPRITKLFYDKKTKELKNNFRVSVEPVKKRFKSNYTKGYVEGNDVRPLVIENEN